MSAPVTEGLENIRLVDGVVARGRNRVGFEFKRTTAPSLTRSMRNALADLKLQNLYVIHAGEHTFTMEKKVKAIAFSSLLKELSPVQ